MKNTNTNYLLSFVAALSFILGACTQETPRMDPTIPELINRTDKIQYGKEWDQVQNKYSKLKMTLSKEGNHNEEKLQLANLYIQEARVTGEHGHYYPAALQMTSDILESKELTTDMRFLALMTKAGVQLSLHNFTEALKTGNEAILINPANAQVYGVLVDANVELGDYEKAVRLADKMITLRPDIRSYSRISYLREIFGDMEGAIEAMILAAKAGFPGTEETSWALLTLGQLYEKNNDFSQAEKVYEEILTVRPNYPFAVGALGDLYLQSKNYTKAKQYIDRAIEIIPEVGFYISKAKYLKSQNEIEAMHQLLDKILVMLSEDEASGHNMNLEYASIYLNLIENVDQAEVFALKEYNKRPDNKDVNKLLGSIYHVKGDAELSKIHDLASMVSIKS